MAGLGPKIYNIKVIAKSLSKPIRNLTNVDVQPVLYG